MKMTKLMTYHTVMCDPEHYWENNFVAKLLKEGEITTYEEYEKQCKIAGSACYSEEVFIAHQANIAFN